MMIEGALGRVYEDGEVITREGDTAHCMFVVQQGTVEVVKNADGEEAVIATLEKGDVFGEMSLFTKAARSATVRASGKARVLTIDKKGFLKRAHQDPSLAFKILQKMSQRVAALNEEVVALRSQVRRAG